MFNGSMVQWFKVQLFDGSIVQGSVVRMFDGSMVQLFNCSVVQWFIPLAHINSTLRHCEPACQ
jgi:hypothetical protein